MYIKYPPSSLVEIYILHIFMCSPVCLFWKIPDNRVAFFSTYLIIFTYAVLKIMVDNICVCAVAFCASFSKVCLILQEQFQGFKITVRTVQRIISKIPVKKEWNRKRVDYFLSIIMAHSHPLLIILLNLLTNLIFPQDLIGITIHYFILIQRFGH